MASWEWNVECCVCRAPFPASLTAQTHANDQYYWSTIDGLATKQEKLITTKALLSFNYWSSMAISAAQRHRPTLISNKNKKKWCRWKNWGRWKVDKIIWLSVQPGRNEGWFEEKGVGRTKEVLRIAWVLAENCLKTESMWCLRDLGRLNFYFIFFKENDCQASLIQSCGRKRFVMLLNDDLPHRRFNEVSKSGDFFLFVFFCTQMRFVS